jgi:hypothetical protein
MSLTVYLEQPSVPESTVIFIRENGQNREITRAEWNQRFPGRIPLTASKSAGTAYSDNITHNLEHMAYAAGLYDAVWVPEQHGIEIAAQLIAPLREGLARLKENPDHFKAFNPANEWGTYEGLVTFIEQYLKACETHPDATVRVSR